MSCGVIALPLLAGGTLGCSVGSREAAQKPQKGGANRCRARERRTMCSQFGFCRYDCAESYVFMFGHWQGAATILFNL